MTPEQERIAQLEVAIRRLLTLDEMEFGDESLLPDNHPVVLARALVGY